MVKLCLFAFVSPVFAGAFPGAPDYLTKAIKLKRDCCHPGGIPAQYDSVSASGRTSAFPISPGPANTYLIAGILPENCGREVISRNCAEAASRLVNGLLRGLTA